MQAWWKMLLVLAVVSLMAGSAALGYVARRNEWISVSARTQGRSILAGLGLLKSKSEKRVSDGATSSAYGLNDTNWSQVDQNSAQSSALDKEGEEALNALGYVDASVRPISADSGVVYSDPQRCFGGYRLYLSGHQPEACLIAADGSLVHSWSVPFPVAFPNISPHGVYGERFRRAHVYPDGSLLAIFDLAGLVKLRLDSSVEWTHAGGSHHDLEVQPDGSIYLIDSAWESVPGYESAIIDYITRLSGDGEVLSRVSVYECLLRSEYATLLAHAPQRSDILHTNTLHILEHSEKDMLRPLLSRPGLDDPTAATMALVSWREIDTIAIINLDNRVVVWALTGLWRAQHEPVISPHGTLVVFDNQSLGMRSRLVEVDPSTQAILWQYAGTSSRPFICMMGGAVYLLPTGNIFVVETTRGRAFELTREKEIVWEYLSPHRMRIDGEEYVANLYDMVPIAAEQLPFVTTLRNGGD